MDTRHTWTMMFYLAGDNNLSDEMVWALKEVYRVGTPKGVAVTLQFDPLAEGRSTRFYSPPTSRDPFDADGVFPILHDYELPETDCGDPGVLVDFVRRSVEVAPARYYMLILAGHGSGVVGDFLTDEDAKREVQPGSLSIPDLRQVFEQLRPALGEKFFEGRSEAAIDVLGMDSCLMSMVEVCSEIKGKVSFLVGSEGFNPNTGWPYFRLLQRLGELAQSKQLPPPEPLASALVKRYTTYYSDFTDAGLSVDMAACDVSQPRVDRLERSVREFVDYCRKAGDWVYDPIVLAHWKAQSYKWEHYTDLWDFFHLLEEEGQSRSKTSSERYGERYDELAKLSRAVLEAVESMVKYSDYSGVEFQHSHGLSIYFPWSRQSFAEEYGATHFARATGWDAFLERYFDVTQRKPRTLPSSEEADGQAVIEHPDVGVTVTREGDDVTIVAARVSAPSSRMSQSSSRVSAPSSRVSAPSSRVSAPSSRVSAPSSRFAQQLDSLVNTLSSTMKNPPTDGQSVLRFRSEDWPRIERLKRSQEIRTMLQQAGEAGKRLLAKLEAPDEKHTQTSGADHSTPSRRERKKARARRVGSP
jgi:hypothetical protein